MVMCGPITLAKNIYDNVVIYRGMSWTDFVKPRQKL